MKKTNDGGPVFSGPQRMGAFLVECGFAKRHPAAAKEIQEFPPVETCGITVRKLFAGMALQGIISSPRVFTLHGKPTINTEDIVTAAYNIADEMIKKGSL
jgi:hypothetical protein